MIYFQDGDTAKTLEALLELLYTDNDGEPSTARQTYNNPELNELQCYGDSRSFEDLLDIARTYFPDTSEVELLSVLQGIWLGCYENSIDTQEKQT